MINLRAVLVPAAVFQSVIVGGAYGSGREVVEYISAFGASGGLLAIVVVAVSFSLVLATSFEFARVFQAWDYRRFLRTLLGPAWIAYELMFAALLVVILAVTGATAGEILLRSFGIAESLGVGILFASVVVLNFLGRAVVTRTLALGAIVLSVGILLYSAGVLSRPGAFNLAQFNASAIEPGWLLSGIKFAVYNSALIPVIVYCARDLNDRASTLSAGVLAGLLGVIPALFFHLSFVTGSPQVLQEALPTYWMITAYLGAQFLPLYVLVLFATVVQTGVGVLQGLNERLDGWREEHHGQRFSARFHAVLAGILLSLSLALSKLGLVALIAQGYGTLAWGFFFVFTIPLISRGIYQIITRAYLTTRN